MDRIVALVFIAVCFILFFILVYFGVNCPLIESLVFSTLLAVILLNYFYPLSQLANDEADYSALIYALVEIIGIVVIIIYVAYKTLTSSRCGT